MQQLVTVNAAALCQFVADLFEAAGSPHEHATIVADSLVRSSLIGYDSHGVVAVPRYLGYIEGGTLVPSAVPIILRQTPATCLMDGQWGFGQVAARYAMREAIGRARNVGVGVVALKRSNHVGRLGEYVELAAHEGFVGIAMINNHGGGLWMCPWGGKQKRLSPNPIAFAVPVGESPVLLDISTTVIPFGKVQGALNRGQKLPEGCALNSEGNPTIEPAEVAGTPSGSLLPFGGLVGYKGFGLGVIADLLAGGLSTAGCSKSESLYPGNAVLVMAVDVAAFVPLDEFEREAARFIRYLKDCPKMPGVEEIMIPGEPERRAEEERKQCGIPVAASLWETLCEKARAVGVSIPVLCQL